MEILKTDRKLAVLIDPDKWASIDQMTELIHALKQSSADLILVGGSLMTNDLFDKTIQYLTLNLSIPVLIFPGNGLQVSSKADGILLLSLISGRNPEFLIGQHVVAAPHIARSGIPVLPTGYLLIDGGKATAASYMSGTTPIPHDQTSIAVCTAMAGEQLGLQAIYLDGGSGANNNMSIEMIQAVAESVKIPLIVGGGIRCANEVQEKWDAGANVVVIGTAIENNLSLLKDFAGANEEL